MNQASAKTTGQKLALYFKGMAMGAADVVPGVSGGTIAFISGIYQELLDSISGIKPSLLKVWKREGFKAMWKQANGSFFLVLLAGIGTSIVLLATLIKFLLETHPIPVWSFFFGLVLASIFLVGKRVKKWGLLSVIGLIAGSLLAYWITTMTPVGETDSLLYIFFCGTVAITAMILPGISGSFILLLLGAYTTILGSVSGSLEALGSKDWDALASNVLRLIVFALGCVAGLLGFSKLLSWLFKRAHDVTVAILAGFLIGSLNKLWPWKETLETFVKHKGEANEELVPLVQRNILPSQFETLAQEPSQLGLSIAMLVIGAAIIFLLAKFSPDE